MRVSATEASRGFSGLLSRVCAGETVEIDRHGEVVAVFSPPRRSTLPGPEFLSLLHGLPRADDQFQNDVAELGKVILHPKDPWQS